MDMTALLGSWVATHHHSMHLGELSCCDVQGLSSSAIYKARSYPSYSANQFCANRVVVVVVVVLIAK
jgi:hypothetical protein